MSGREWKPGDVATFAGETVVRTDDGVWIWVATGLRLHRQSEADLEARPLVVIDPEDREQVREVYRALEQGPDSYWPEDLIGFTAALRHLADPKPPKPEEPTGLGAVVEDEDGKRWVRGDEDTVSWYGPDGWRKYHEINAVRVLSEGVVA